jgi:hypothetical protein
MSGMRSALLAEVHEALDRVDADGLVGGALSDAVADAYAVLNRAQALCATLVGQLDAEGVGDGALTTAAWISWRCRTTKAVAKRDVSNARALREMPAVEAAFSDGVINADHVRALASAMRADAESFEKVEQSLVDEATTRPFEPWSRIVEYWRQQAAADLAEREAQDRDQQRRLHLSQTFESMWRLDALLTPVGGSIVEGELRQREKALFDADWAEARERLGDAAGVHDLRRTPAQRRHDALVEMARRSSAADGRTPARPLITVLVGYETFAGRICELTNGAVVTPGEVVPLLRDADIERVVFDGPSRVLDVGVKQRLFTGATRRAVEVRDRTCFHPTCDEPAEHCEVDHVIDWAFGGPTVQANGRLACPRHHRRKPRAGPAP